MGKIAERDSTDVEVVRHMNKCGTMETNGLLKILSQTEVV